jgi:predicted GNAT family N-acyltransferase
MLHTVPLNSSYNKNSFACEEPALENYLRLQAGQDLRKQVAACFVLEGHGNAVKGYYTLSADGVDRTLIPESVKKKLPYKTLPVFLLGRLARDINYKGEGVGELLLADSLKRAWEASTSIGACAVVTDPINEKARTFYQSFGFISLESGRMFIPMETIRKLFTNPMR